MKVTIEFSSGRALVKAVPLGYEIHIKDYDKDKYYEDSLEPDENKVMCKYTIYGNAETKKVKETINLSIKNNKIKNHSKLDVVVNEISKKGKVETYTI